MGNQVTIRPVELSDADSVQQYASDSALAQTCNVPHPYPAGGGAAFVERVVQGRETGQRYAFAILCNGNFAGLMTLNAVDKQVGTAELDYWVAVPFWNMGIGTAAATPAIKFAFEELGLSTLQSCCLLGNVASVRVLEKNGFVQVGEFVNDGKYGNKFLGQSMKRFQLKCNRGS